MHILEHTKRFTRIEKRFNSLLPELVYQMHWLEDMKHRDIALMLNAPRTTVTRWFRLLQVPTQSCRRFTDKNLTSWLYKTGKLKKKIKYGGYDSRLQEIRKRVNIDFFKKWSAQMAYVLGFFAADGCMFVNPRGSKYVSFSSTDYEILRKVKQALESEHKIALKKRRIKNWKDSFVLQIGSKQMYNDLIALGFMQNKAKRFNLPKVPAKHLNHFIRGYFDGDGSIVYGHFERRDRNNRVTPYILTSFASANTDFLRRISDSLVKNINIGRGYLDKKSDHLSYSKLDSIKLFRYMYKDVTKKLYLERKYSKFQEALKTIGAVA